ncbi:MAG TPA: FHA domain-containing protein [Thermoanaerobaculia bacterium]
MPLIRCPKCSQAYDVPGVIAVRLANSIATCDCGEWLSGSKAAVLAGLVNADQIRKIDMAPYRTEEPRESAPSAPPAASAPVRGSRSIRVIARDSRQAIDAVFTLSEHPLWIGRKSAHVQLDEAELSIRHCSISLQGDSLILRDADSHMGTFLDGNRISEAAIGEGVHILRAGAALISIEPVETGGTAVEPLSLADESLLAGPFDTRPLDLGSQPSPVPSAETRFVLICMEGTLAGQEFEIPPGGLTVGREGHVRVPDEFLSRRHFEVNRAEDGTIRVRDLGSRNGTFLNTLPASNTRVTAGDEIRAGVNRFRVEKRLLPH